MLRLRECPVELTSHCSELASKRTISSRGSTLYNDLGPFAIRFNSGDMYRLMGQELARSVHGAGRSAMCQQYRQCGDMGS
jgi:hypothetical protein